MKIIRKIKFILSAAFILIITACSSSGSDDNDNPIQISPDPEPELVIETQTVDLKMYVDNLPFVGSGSEAYVIPTQQELDTFATLIFDLNEANLREVQNNASEANFKLLRIIDTENNNNELDCLEEIVSRGQGFYCIDPDSVNPHHSSAPHSLFDTNTDEASVTVMRDTDARFLSVSTAHRCANSEKSLCSGTTTVCGQSEEYRVSDAAHNVNSYFYHFGKTAFDLNADSYTFQFHGCGATACPSNGLSTDRLASFSRGGSSDDDETSMPNILASKLNEVTNIFLLGTATSCNKLGDPDILCGGTNTLARYMRNSPDACTLDGVLTSESQFVHMETNANLRLDSGAGDRITPATLAEAINIAYEERLQVAQP